MSSADELTYAAVIAVSLPGMDGEASAHITLTAADQVEVGNQVLLLQDCTLADIRAFADTLEEQVWQTYQSIRLVDLAEEETSSVEVRVRDKKGKTVTIPNWRQQAILLADMKQTSEVLQASMEAVEPDVPQLHGSEKDTGRDSELTIAEVAQEEPKDADKTPKEEVFGVPDEETLPQVMVSESEPVYAEREAVDDPGAFPTPAIAPSQARVRIAGKRLPLGHHTWAAVDILIDEPAFRSAQAHALSSLNREVAGVLVGPPPEKQPDGRYVVHIVDTIVAKHTVMQGASVTYTPESWRYMNDRLAERYPEETAVIVGWYHTHPGFGIFLSGMDQFIHQNFFTQIWHTAMVLDPVARKSGFFCWDRGMTRVSQYQMAWPDWAVPSW